MEQIKQFATQVFTTLGAGFSERVYHNAMEVLLTKHGIQFKSEHNIPVLFEGVEVGKVRADLIVNDSIVVELKSIRSIKDECVTQCQMYMKLLNLERGLVINFPCSDMEEVECEEIVNTPICKRCGRDSHLASGCYARTHINGTRLTSST